MEQIQIQKTTIKTPRLWLGGWQASGWTSSDDKKFMQVVEHAITSGLSAIDTAELYGNGHSEHLIGRVIKDKRDKVIIASKFAHTHSRAKPLRSALEKSLKRLGTDYLDLYQYHWPAKDTPLDETILELEKLKGEGLIRAFGVCNWMKPEFDECNYQGDVSSVQNAHSLFWRRSEEFVLPHCKEKGLFFLAYSPLFQGFLAKDSIDFENLPKDYRKRLTIFQNETYDSLKPMLDLIGEFAEKYKKTRAQIALRWVLDTPGVSAAIVGASKLEQVDDNLGALGWSLENEDYQALAKLSPEYSKSGDVYDSMWGWHSRS